MRKRKQQVYDQYLERRAMLRDFASMAAFLASDAWAALYSARLARCCCRFRHMIAGLYVQGPTVRPGAAAADIVCAAGLSGASFI